MKATCPNCDWQAQVSKSQAFDLARFEGCPNCGGDLKISEA
jgi:rRNA maturation protein Nop10